MKTASIVELKKNLSRYLVLAQKGEGIEVLKHNVPVAHLIGIPRDAVKRTRLGCGTGTGRILGDLTESSVTGDAKILAYPHVQTVW